MYDGKRNAFHSRVHGFRLLVAFHNSPERFSAPFVLVWLLCVRCATHQDAMCPSISYSFISLFFMMIFQNFVHNFRLLFSYSTHSFCLFIQFNINTHIHIHTASDVMMIIINAAVCCWCFGSVHTPHSTTKYTCWRSLFTRERTVERCSREFTEWSVLHRSDDRQKYR